MLACWLAWVAGCAEAPSVEPLMVIEGPGEVVLAPGEERYLCFSVPVEAGLAVDQVAYDFPPGLHHALVARTRGAEIPACQELAMTQVMEGAESRWTPMLVGGPGTVVVTAPAGSAFHLQAGTSLMFQLHFLNPTPDTLTIPVAITLRPAAPDTADVGMAAFGSGDVSIPAASESTMAFECVLDQAVEVFALIPHMHEIGQRLRLEVSEDDGETWTEVYRSDPFDFYEQVIDPHPATYPAGTVLRTTCTWDNPHPTTVGPPGSAQREMCYAMAFVTSVPTCRLRAR